MKSLLEKRLPGILAVGLVALAVGAASAPASAAPGASASSLTPAQAKKKKAELKKCKKKPTAKKRTACKKAVNKKYAKLAAPKGITKVVDVGDNYFAPFDVQLKSNDSIKWSWAGVQGFEAHNVTLATGPAGVDRYAFVSHTTAVPSYTFKRTFTKTGDYHFVCSLHTGMEMNVKVSN